nr:glycerol-3-phosphate responsive antiterminator [Brucella anthropi]
MLGYLSAEDKRRLPPIVASGFICNEDDVSAAMKQGAIAVSSSNKSLWNYGGRR